MGAWRNEIKEESSALGGHGGHSRSYAPVPLRLAQGQHEIPKLSKPTACPERKDHPGNRSRSFIFQNFPVDVRGTASMNS